MKDFCVGTHFFKCKCPAAQPSFEWSDFAERLAHVSTARSAAVDIALSKRGVFCFVYIAMGAVMLLFILEKRPGSDLSLNDWAIAGYDAMLLAFGPSMKRAVRN
jgi:hypothetical protein